jgi:outer membrane protein OmpA-like peptidoglycan-associated protein
MNLNSINNVVHGKQEPEDQWISLSDIMAGLMMVFLLIAIVFMLKIQNVAKNIKDIERDLHKELEIVFKDDFREWNAELDVLTIRFREPRVLFEGGKDKLRFRFKRILNKFIPRYLNIINSTRYKDYISEVRIEGHTSSDFKNLSPANAYIENMKLSQRRAQNSLVYILTIIPGIEPHRKWFRKNVAAIGMSSSRLIQKNGTENRGQSRRVEFRILLKTDEAISKIHQITK